MKHARPVSMILCALSCFAFFEESQAKRIYKCPSDTGVSVFQEIPCSDGAEAEKIWDIGGQNRYVGRPLTLTFRDFPLRTIIQLLSEESGITMHLDKEADMDVNIHAVDRPWDEIFHGLMRRHGLRFEIYNDQIFIMKSS